MTEGNDTATNPTSPRELSFGERAVGITFNPSSDPKVQIIKGSLATVIDYLNDLRTEAGPGEVGRMLSTAITELQTAQMWAVKAVTWQY